MTVDDAVALLMRRHVAAARLLQRSPPGSACDPADAAAWRALADECEAMSDEVLAAAADVRRAQHSCRELAACPLGPRPRRPA